MPADVSIVQYEQSGGNDRIIVVGVPTFGAVSIQWHGHMMQLQTPLNRAIRHVYVMGKEVGDARNEIAEQMLALRGPLGERAKGLIFIDDDVLVPPDTVARLLSHNRPIMSGLYYAKTVAPQPLILKSPHDGLVTEWEPGAVIDCFAHGMGCTWIAREVFEALDPPWFKTTRQDHSQRDGVNVFQSQTEDVYFLERAKAAGFQPAVDSGLACWHWSMSERIAYPVQSWQRKTAAEAAA